jgi:hypothetical protein
MSLRTTHLLAFSTFACVLLTQGCMPHNYQTDVSNRLQVLLKTPNNNQPINGYIFGSLLPAVGTMFCADYTSKWPITPDNGCQFETTGTYFSAAVSDADKKAILAAIITPTEGGTVSLSDDVTKEVKFDVAVPIVGNLANLAGNADIKKHTTVTIDGTKVIRRTVNWDQLTIADGNNKFNSAMHAHLQRKDYILAASDIVINDYSVTVKIDNSVSAGTKDTLSSAFQALGANSSLNVDTSAANTGTYKVTSKDPVVVAGLYVKPPTGGGASGATTDVKTWPQVHLVGVTGTHK